MKSKTYKYLLVLLLVLSLTLVLSACGSQSTGTDNSVNTTDYYTLTIATDGNGQTTPSPGTYTKEEGTIVSLSVDPNSGHQFSGWSGPDSNDVASTNEGYKITMNENKEIIAVFSEANSWNVKNYIQQNTDGQITSVNFTQQGDNFVIFSLENSTNSFIKIWDPYNDEIITLFDKHPYGINSFAVSSNNTIVSCSGSDAAHNYNTVIVWEFDKTTGETNVIKKYNDHGNKIVQTVDISSDGSKVVSGTRSGTIKVWSIRNPNESVDFNGHNDLIEEVEFFPQSDKVASCSDDKTIKIWNATDGTIINELEQNSRIITLDISTDGDKIAFGTANGKMKVWDLNKTKSDNITAFEQPKSGIYSVEFSADDKYIVVGTFSDQEWSGLIKIWDTEKNQIVNEFGEDVHSEDVNSVDISSNNSWIISGSMDSKVVLWE